MINETQSMIELNNISKKYSRGAETFTALDNISLKIGKGDFWSVIGESGAGKSTLLYVIGGLIHPDSGTVSFNGHDIYKMNVREANRYRKIHLGFMFQQFHLMPWLTVTENISLACYKKNHKEKIDYYIEKCLLSRMKNKFPSELSMGEKQRTAFIRAVISKPDILLADEPTGNLDAGNSEILMSLVKEYQENGGTVVLVSHNKDIIRYSDSSVTLVKGEVI
jgi:putative ABC transport system ATP-binding protein